MSRLPFTIDAQFKAYKLRNIPTVAVEPFDWFGSVAIIAASAFVGAVLAWVI